MENPKQFKLGEVVTLINERTGEPYKKYYGIVQTIYNVKDRRFYKRIRTSNPNFIWCDSEVVWLKSPKYWQREVSTMNLVKFTKEEL